MRSFIFGLSALLLTQLAAAQPHGHNRHGQVHDHVQKRDSEIVYVDSAGSTISIGTATAGAPAATSTVDVSAGGLGLTYSPYTSSGDCKSTSEVLSDISSIPSSYSTLRIYGVDCNQVANVVAAASAKGFKIFAGIFDLSNVSGDLETLINGVAGNWGIITTVAIGNELVGSKGVAPSTVVAAIGTARSILSSGGYSGPVVTVDIFSAIIAHPELCTASDYCAANCHAFFDADLTAPGAGAYVAEQAALVSAAAGGKKTVITESGWPHQGNANGDAVPGLQQQKDAISSLKSSSALAGALFLFTAWDDLWKSPGEFDVEQYWGILGH